MTAGSNLHLQEKQWRSKSFCFFFFASVGCFACARCCFFSVMLLAHNVCCVNKMYPSHSSRSSSWCKEFSSQPSEKTKWKRWSGKDEEKRRRKDEGKDEVAVQTDILEFLALFLQKGRNTLENEELECLLDGFEWISYSSPFSFLGLTPQFFGIPDRTVRDGAWLRTGLSLKVFLDSSVLD